MIDPKVVKKLQGLVYPKACWYNALETLRFAPKGSVYVEGACVSQIAMRNGSVFNMVLDHGWVETEDGDVWDITDVVSKLNAIEYESWLKLTPAQLLAANVIKPNGKPVKQIVRELLIDDEVFEVLFGSKGEKIRRDMIHQKSDIMGAKWKKYSSQG